LINDDDVVIINLILKQIGTYLLTEEEVATSNSFSNPESYYIYVQNLLTNKRNTNNNVLMELIKHAQKNNVMLNEELKTLDIFFISSV
jgi:hypothetical protein